MGQLNKMLGLRRRIRNESESLREEIKLFMNETDVNIAKLRSEKIRSYSEKIEKLTEELKTLYNSQKG